MKNLKNVFAATSLVLSLTCCATIFSGTTQVINLQAVDADTNEPLDGVTCKVSDAKGLSYAVQTNPGTFTATKGNGVLTPTCKKAGYKQESFGVGEDFNGVTLVNVLFWPGFIVDTVSGAIKEYPSHITVFMKKS